MNIRTILTLIVSLILISSCKGETSDLRGETATSTSPAALPPGHPPVNPADGGMAESAGGATIAWDLPASWTQTTPGSSMRLAQATIPGPAGEGQVIVYFFGVDGGGGVEPNLQRWEQQVTGTAPATRETFEAGAFRISLIEKSGTLEPSTMGSGPATPQPDMRMIAAVVEGEGGPWYIKATGPDATILEAREDFLAMLRSIRQVTGTPV